jgi:peptidoglycan-associated lipoprotein
MVLILAMFLALGTGCAKKKVASEPVEAGEQQDAAAGMEKKEKYDGMMTAEEKALAEAERKKKQKAMQAKEMLISEKIYFDFDKYDLKPQYKDVLKEKAEILKNYPGWNMLIEGHCDERGTEEYNLALGERRARSAYEFLVILGVDSGRMKIVSFGEEKPAVQGSNEEAWAKNRRCEFRVFE